MNIECENKPWAVSSAHLDSGLTVHVFTTGNVVT